MSSNARSSNNTNMFTCTSDSNNAISTSNTANAMSTSDTHNTRATSEVLITQTHGGSTPSSALPTNLDWLVLSNSNLNSDATIQSNQFQSHSSNLSNTAITCCYLNIRSIVNKLSLFQSYIYSSDFDVICLTETWLSESVFDQEILPTNYNIYRKDRPSRGGGVLIAIKSTISASVVCSDPVSYTHLTLPTTPNV